MQHELRQHLAGGIVACALEGEEFRSNQPAGADEQDLYQLVCIVRQTCDYVAVTVRGRDRGLLLVQLLNGANPVAIRGRALVIHGLCAFVHPLGQLRDHGVVFAV